MARLEISIYVGLQIGEHPTLGHVRQWLSEVDKFNIPDTHPLESIDLGLSFFVDPQKVNPTLCGDCSPKEEHNDVLVTTHTCRQE